MADAYRHHHRDAHGDGRPGGLPSAWQGVPVPDVKALFDVAVTAANDAWAVSADVNRQAILHWDGLQWLPVPFPTATDTPVSGPRFFAVAAAGSASAWAGGAATGNLPAQMQHWDSTAWQVITSTLAGRDAPATTYDFYKGIAALGPNEAYATRSSGVGVNTFAGLERCTATGCTPLSSLHPGHFEGLGALSSTNIWIAGDAIYHWDGTTLALATIVATATSSAWRRGRPTMCGWWASPMTCPAPTR